MCDRCPAVGNDCIYVQHDSKCGAVMRRYDVFVMGADTLDDQL